jgi:hypothetical protein
MRFLPWTLFLALSVFLTAIRVAPAATYYVSNQGADRNDGLSPATAWATLDRVNRGPFREGDKILFCRNGVWRGQLVPHNGSEAGCVTYAAYGEGAKPLLLGSASRNRPADWSDEGGGVWSAGEFPVDVGNIIFGDEARCGVKVCREADLKREGDYWYDAARRVVRLRMAENPAKRYARIECALNAHIINQRSRSYVVYENLALKYGAAHGIGGSNTHHIVVRDCDISFVGGGLHHGTVRFGNGIEFWSKAHDNLVERCRLWEIYDAALSNQNNGPRTPQYNIIYRNNTIWNSEYSFEYWNRPENSETRDIYFVGNTCVNAGYGWGHGQRRDPSGRHLCFYTSPARAKNIVIRNNIFCGAKGRAFYAPQWSKAQIDGLVMDRNCWYQAEGAMLALGKSFYTMAEFAKYQAEWSKEPHSICALPRFMDAAHGNFRLAPDWPRVDNGDGKGGDRKGAE